jgi:solute carrier family 35 protein E3
VVTYLGLVACACFGVFKPKSISLKSVLPICLSFCGFVILTNLSLVYNSIGFYQIAKIGTMPTVMMIQIIFYHMHFSNAIKRCIVLICFGVLVASATDVNVNFFGSIIAACACVSTALYQIWIGTTQKDLGVDSMQLLYYQAPVAGLLLLPMIPFLDDVHKFMSFEWSGSAVIAISISALLAFCVNLSTFLIIGRFSAMYILFLIIALIMLLEISKL